MKQSKFEIINKMLLHNPYGFHYPYGQYNPSIEQSWAFCVHESVLENILHSSFINPEWKISEYTLHIGRKYFDMRLIIVPPGTIEKVFYIFTAIQQAQFSFPWNDKPNLFINVGSFIILQQFIKIQRLEESILKIQNHPGISSTTDEIIKVVTFNQSVNGISLFEKYEEYLLSISASYHPPQYYYMTHAFRWIQPYWLAHFEIPIGVQFDTVFSIFLNHLGTLRYANNLNIFDLLMLRLAFCNYHNPFPSCRIKLETDFMIKRELLEIVQHNSHLDLDQYMIEKNCVQREYLISYLLYEFQDNFETVFTTCSIDPEYQARKFHVILKLTNERNILQKIKDQSNIEFTIDGRNYDRMSLSLFLDLVECHNVHTIMLHTNYRWLRDDAYPLNRNINNALLRIKVSLIGENTNNFIEHFVSSLKSVTFSKGTVSLRIINGQLKDYTIFDNLNIDTIEFCCIEIDHNMLNDLNKCNIKSKLRALNCSFQNTSNNWAQLIKLKNFEYAEILEDENTWLAFFEFIMAEFFKSNSKDIQVDVKNLKIKSDKSTVSIGKMKFQINELNTKLEMYDHTNNNEIVDIFELKYEVEPNDKFEYDFYQ